MSSEAKKVASSTEQHSGGEHSKKSEAPVKSGKNMGPVPGGCACWGCKKPEQQFSFCHEHYDHFKFGLIKKSGEPVPDYEKKFEHFQAWKSKQKTAHKVA